MYSVSLNLVKSNKFGLLQRLLCTLYTLLHCLQVVRNLKRNLTRFQKRAILKGKINLFKGICSVATYNS